MSKRGAPGHRREGRGDPLKHDAQPHPNPSRRVLPSGAQGPLHSGGYYGGPFGDLRRTEAAERSAYCAKLTPAERIARLDRRLGEGIGAERERERLSKMLGK